MQNYFIRKKLRQCHDRISWIQESNTDDVFDKLLALSEQENACVLQNTSRDTVYDIITSGEEDFFDYTSSVSRNEKKNTVEGREALRKNARNEEQGRISETNVLLHKRNVFKTKLAKLDGERKKIKLDFHSEFKNYSRTAASPETSRTSQNTHGHWKHDMQTFYYPTIISDVSSDDDDSIYGKKSTVFDLEKKLANAMHKKKFQSHKLKQHNYSQRNGQVMCNSPKKKSVKPSRNKINKSNSYSHRITANPSAKFSLDKFSASTSESQRITSIREGNFVQTLQRNAQEQILSVKNNISSERRAQTEAPQKANQKRVSNIKDNKSLPKVSYVRKLEIQNQRRRDIEYLRNILEDDLPTPDLNSLCTYTENDNLVHPLLSTNLSLAGKEKQSQNTEVIQPLPSNEEPVLLFNPLGEMSSSETCHPKSPPCIGSILSLSSPERRKTSTPVSSQFTGISFSLSPIDNSENVDRIFSGLANESEKLAENSCNLPSQIIQDIRRHKGHLIMTTSRQKQKNLTEMGFPNPIGTNKCWMNSSLQTVFGMKPFIQDLLNNYEKTNTIETRGKYSSLVESFIQVVKAKHRKNQSQLNKNLELLYQSLGVLNEHFTTHSQEDAVEFLTEFFSALRDEFNRLMHSNKMHAARPNKCQSEHTSNITDAVNDCQEDESNTYSQLKNPVDENIIFKLKESHSCMMCSEHTITETEHFTLILSVPPDTSKGITLQEALERCMVTETRELKCVQCESHQCRVKTMFTLLPRFLMIHVNRFEMKNDVIKKMHKYLKIPITLTLKNMISKTETMLPLQWMSDNHKRFSWSEEKERSSCSPRNNDGGEEFQHTVQGGKEDSIETKQEYMLLAIISHKGDTPNCGHYEADVYNVTTRKWNHLNDEVVTSETEEEVTGFSQQENGYAFLYIYKPLFIQLVNECEVPRSNENQ